MLLHNNNDRKSFSWKSSRWITLVLVLCIVFVCGVFVFTASYTTFAVDDFLYMSEYDAGKGILSLLQSSLAYTISVYLTHAGAYTTYFLGDVNIYLIVEEWLSLPQIMVLGTGLFMAALVLFTISAVCHSGICRGRSERNVALFFCAAVLLMLYSSQDWPEIHSWCSGYNAYALPVTFGLLAATLMSRSRPNGPLRTAAGCLCAFLACGGTLQVTGFTVYLLFLLFLVKLVQKRTSAGDWFILGAAIAGTLVNIAAPGNFVRRESIDATGFHPLSALPWVFRWGTEVYASLFSNILIVAVLLLVLLLGVQQHSRFAQKTQHFSLLLLACVLTPYVIALPVCVGYGGSYFPNRCVWLTTLATTLAMLAAFFTLGILFGRYCPKLAANPRLAKAACTAAVLLVVVGMLTAPGQSAIFSTLSHLRDGSIAAYRQQMLDLLAYFENTEETDVVITQFPAGVPELVPFYLEADPDVWINQAIAQYYGLNSVSYQPQT